MSRWRLAARLARRETRAHPWRTLLVIVIIALPVLGAQTAILALRSAQSTDDLRPRLERDGADYLAVLGPDGTYDWIDGLRFPVVAAPDGSWVPGSPTSVQQPRTAPPGARTVRTFALHAWAATDEPHPLGDGPRLARVRAVGLVPGSPANRLEEGRWPTDRDEVVANAAALDATGLAVGQRMHLVEHDVELTIVGRSERRVDPHEPLVVVGPPGPGPDWVASALGAGPGRSDFSSGPGQEQELIWMPDGWTPPAPPVNPSPYEVRLSPRRLDGVVAASAAVAGLVGLIAVTCSAAFAIGARRQLRSLGILGAAGARPADLFRSVLLQGTACGLLGGALATTVAYGARALILATDLFGRVTWFGAPSVLDRPIPPSARDVLAPAALGVVAGTLAALVPALSASRVPLLSALAGRRPLPPVKAGTPVAGLVALAVGTLILTDGTRRAIDGVGPSPALMVLAALAVIFGGVATAPALVALTGRLAGRARGTLRLAVRGLVRSRARSAAVIGAAAVALAIPIAVTTWDAAVTDPWASSDWDSWDGYAELRFVQGLPDDADADQAQVLMVAPGRLAPALLDRVAAALGPDAVVRPAVRVYNERPAVVVDAATARALGEPELAAVLARGRAAALAPLRQIGFPEQAVDAEGRLVSPTVTRDGQPLPVELLLPRHLGGAGHFLLHHGLAVPPDALSDRALAVNGAGGVAIRPGALTADEDRAVRALTGAGPTLTDLVDPPVWGSALSVQTNHRTRSVDRGDIALRAVQGAAILLALAIIATALALAAADGQDDERLYAALGAPPHLLRRRRTAEAGLLAVGASVLGVVIGMFPTWAILWSQSRTRWSVVGPLVDGIDGRFTPLAAAPPVGAIAIGTIGLVVGTVWLSLGLRDLFRRRSDIALVRG